MAIDPDTFYGTVALGDTYFGESLHETDWSTATSDRKERALLAATKSVDALVYAGYKTPVYDLLVADPDATDEEIEAAAATQLLEFPRDGSDTVPDDILFAVYEIARELLRGRDPQQEFENLWIGSEGAGSTRASYDRAGMLPIRHLSNGIVSFYAWRFLQPYLENQNSFDVRRVS